MCFQWSSVLLSPPPQGADSAPPDRDRSNQAWFVGWQIAIVSPALRTMACSLQKCRKGWLSPGIVARNTCCEMKKKRPLNLMTFRPYRLSRHLPRFISRVSLKYTNQLVALKSDLLSTSVNLCLVSSLPPHISHTQISTCDKVSRLRRAPFQQLCTGHKKSSTEENINLHY